MTMKNTVLLLFAATLMISCEGKKENTETNEVTALTVYQEAMKIHDEVMPHMDEMYQLQGKLKKLNDSLRADSVANASKIAIVREKLSALEAANKDMMNWMHDVQDVPGATVAEGGHEHHSADHAEASASKGSSDEQLHIQQEQKKRIEEVRVAMEKSIEEAKKVLTN